MLFTISKEIRVILAFTLEEKYIIRCHESYIVLGVEIAKLLAKNTRQKNFW